MNATEQARFNPLYESMQRALKLQGKARATKDAYSRVVRRTTEYFDRCPDNLSAEELRTYFADLLETHSWSTIKLDRCGLQFFYRHVLDKPWDWVEIVKPPQAQRLPDVLTRGETHRLLGAVYKLRYRVFFVTLSSTGLRLSDNWQTLAEFGLNDKTLHGKLGATAVLHTHSRALDFHPHVHILVPAGAIDPVHNLWRTKQGKFLFPEKALAKVFRGKWFQAMKEQGWTVKANLPRQWVVDSEWVGNGEKALLYLGRYLYRGVLAEKNILACDQGQVTFCYTENSGAIKTRTLPGADFLWLVLQQVLPKGFRRTRDYGFLHGNCKRLIERLYLLLRLCLPKPKEKPALCCKQCGVLFS